MLCGLENQESILTISEENAYIPHRFVQRILSHVLLVSLDSKRKYRHPLILAIQGVPGSGKSYQARYTLTHNGLKAVTIDSSSLAGSLEGDSIKLLKDVYCRLGATNELGAIIIDDFDISIGAQKQNYERTSNSDILNAFLMHLCDNPSAVNGLNLHPVPIILTGNNFTTLYEPLRRHGRTRIFDWEPTVEERTAVVNNILKELSLPNSTVEKLLELYPNKGIAFFHHIKTNLLDDLTIPLLEAAKRANFDRMVFAVSALHKLQGLLQEVSDERIFAAAQEADTNPKDYLSHEHPK